MMGVKDKRFEAANWSGSGGSSGGLLWHRTKFL